jgi:hypothetical protein
MTLTVQGYHLFQIPCAAKDVSSSISFSELENDLGDSYYAQALYGSENGNRRWQLTMPTLDHSSFGARTVTGINGETLSYEAYLWDLFCETKVSGTPFVYQDGRTNQYYLVRFADKELTYQRMLTKLYSAGIELKQWRLPNVTVFGVATSDNGAAIAPFYADYVDGVGWNPDAFGTDFQALIATGNVARSGTQNDLDTVQFNVGGTNDGFLLSDTNGIDFPCCEAFFVMKIREATFSVDQGVFTAPTTDAILVGKASTATFWDFGLGNFEYRLNNVLYPQSAMPAPMNTYGIVHIRKTDGVTFFNGQLQIGKDRNFAGRFAEMDIAEMIFFSELQTVSYRRELLEHLATKWSLNT